jgi:hypothetical protein
MVCFIVLERATQRCGQRDRDLIVHDRFSDCVHCSCNATHCSAQGPRGASVRVKRRAAVLPETTDLKSVERAAIEKAMHDTRFSKSFK